MTQRCYFVTDQGSNVKSALTNFHRFPCAYHTIATVLRHTLQLDSLSRILPMDRNCPVMKFVDAIRTVFAMKSLVGYLKRSGLNNKLSTTIEQASKTRWNSTLVMLQSFVSTEKEVKSIIKIHEQEKRLTDIDVCVVADLIHFLKPFQDATKALEGELNPTIHQVYLWWSVLKTSMNVEPTDNQLITFIKSRGSYVLLQKFEMNIWHKLALFFNPKFKALVAFIVKKNLK